MRLLIISGISGAGKSAVCDHLEDIGYYCIDNLPPSLLVPVSKLNEHNNLAVVIDSRSKEKYQTLLQEIEKLKVDKVDYQLVFLYAQADAVLGRYKYTRRPHPLMDDTCPSLEAAINKEFELSKDIMNAADIVIDTTLLNAAQLRKTIIDSFTTSEYKGITLKIISFGYKNSIPNEADLVYDVRCMPNPFYKDELKPLSGLDKPVVDYVFSFTQSQELIKKMEDYIRFSLPYFIEEGKNELVIAIGCTSGHHRSVAFVEELAKRLSDLNHRIVVIHRDVDKDF